jgi:hypothetical protein
LIFDDVGNAMSPAHTRRRGKQYRYYVSQAVLKAKTDAAQTIRVPAGEIEQLAVSQIRRLLSQPEMIVATWKQLKGAGSPIVESQVRDALLSFDKIWADLFPAEQSRIVQLLIDKVVLAHDRADIHASRASRPSFRRSPPLRRSRPGGRHDSRCADNFAR